MKLNSVVFKKRVLNILLTKNSELQESDFHFAKETSGDYLVYRPLHLQESPADFIVHQDLNGSISVHGNLQAMVPTIEKFEDLDDLERRM